MPTLLCVPATRPGNDGGTSTAFVVEEDFDAVINKIAPVEPPTSTLAQREHFVYHLHPGGERVLLQPSAILWVKEDYDPDDDVL